jgi:preprotein translocase subunit YajC
MVIFFFRSMNSISLIFFAQGNPAPQAAPQGDGGMWLFVALPVILLIMWFLMVNPQKKQEERMKKMIASLDRNDKVMTVGGIIATVHAIDKEQNEIVLKVDDANNVKMRFHLTAISTIFPKEERTGS